jgi:hypothetical protein
VAACRVAEVRLVYRIARAWLRLIDHNPMHL